MQPVLAVYAGYSMKQEHVNPGPISNLTCRTHWTRSSTSPAARTRNGALSARKDGHPQPFKLTYVEIGNEDWFDKSGSYDGRYAQFYKAIKAKYPELQLIATTPVKSVRPDVLDDHFYVRATKFFEDTGALRQDRPQRAEDLCGRVGHAARVRRPRTLARRWAMRPG